ncbi:MAG: PEP-CTERM sorting domain-containing protein [Burkholderiales bacterium]|nr:PEP-CTERM sorting domain-containing protein [Burkholderiales bacterium]
MKTPLKRVLAAAAVVVTLPAQAGLVFDFNNGNQGWTANDPHGVLQAWGDGVLRIADGSSGDLAAVAPTSALGNWSAYLGSEISFDARNTNVPVQNLDYWSGFGTITLRGANGVTLVVDAAPGDDPPADGAWKTFSVSLTEAVWGAQLASVLADVAYFEISGEFQNGIVEITAFDNIQIGSSVPEPASALLAALGLLAAGATARRRA